MLELAGRPLADDLRDGRERAVRAIVLPDLLRLPVRDHVAQPKP